MKTKYSKYECHQFITGHGTHGQANTGGHAAAAASQSHSGGFDEGGQAGQEHIGGGDGGKFGGHTGQLHVCGGHSGH